MLALYDLESPHYCYWGALVRGKKEAADFGRRKLSSELLAAD